MIIILQVVGVLLAVGGGIAYMVLADSERKALGAVPIVIWLFGFLSPVVTILAGEVTMYVVSLGGQIAGAVVGAVLIGKGQTEKLLRLARALEQEAPRVLCTQPPVLVETPETGAYQKPFLGQGVSRGPRSTGPPSGGQVPRAGDSSAPKEQEKRCPYCGEAIRAVAVKCKHCKSMLPSS